MKALNLYSLAVALLLCLQVSLFAQTSCGFDRLQQNYLQLPEHQQQVQLLNSQISVRQASLQTLRTVSRSAVTNAAGATVYEIPVVVHVVHSGEPVGHEYNPTDQTIHNAIKLMNDIWGATASGFPSPGNGGVDIPIRFKLAQTDPNNNPTNGIERLDGSVLPGYAANGIQHPAYNNGGASDIAVKALSPKRWSNLVYYNIWIVKKIAANIGLGGYAYYPSAGSMIDGTVIVASQLPYTTLAHELGHGLGLFHTFEGSSSNICPLNNNCSTDGDMVCDTPPHFEQGCQSSAAYSCSKSDDYNTIAYNIMNYTGCPNRFTPLQKDRAVATLLTQRPSLVASAALNAPAAQTVKPINNCTLSDNVFTDQVLEIGPYMVAVNTLQAASKGYNFDGNQYYIDLSNSLRTTLVAGNNYPVQVTTMYNSQRVKVWVDWNNNSILDPDELLQQSGAPTINGNSTTSTFMITAARLSTAAKGFPLRLRVAADFINSPDFGACSRLEYGQIEDYAVTVETALPAIFGNINATAVQEDISISWSTTSEQNNDHFEIQLSNDGDNFVTLAQVASKAADGNSTAVIDYSYHRSLQGSGLLGILFAGIIILSLVQCKRQHRWLLQVGLLLFCTAYFSCNKDKETLQQKDAGNIFIRIAQVDKDGMKHYSKIVKVIPQ